MSVHAAMFGQLTRRESASLRNTRRRLVLRHPRAIEVSLNLSNRVEHLFQKCPQHAVFRNKRWINVNRIKSRRICADGKLPVRRNSNIGAETRTQDRSETRRF